MNFNPVQLHSKCIFQRQIPMPRIPPVAQKSYLLNRMKRLYRPNAYIHSIMRSLYLKSHARYFSLENVEYENTTSKGLCSHQAGKAYAGSKMYFSLIVHTHSKMFVHFSSYISFCLQYKVIAVRAITTESITFCRVSDLAFSKSQNHQCHGHFLDVFLSRCLFQHSFIVVPAFTTNYYQNPES